MGSFLIADVCVILLIQVHTCCW
uniref:Uncharacterized protein n=1 Tax=Arundo donax TaxID=35708 RepID=A0A0A9B6X6_ARUDO